MIIIRMSQVPKKNRQPDNDDKKKAKINKKNYKINFFLFAPL